VHTYIWINTKESTCHQKAHTWKCTIQIHHTDTPASPKHPVFIEARELSKRFGDIAAVDRVSFEVNQGEIFGFLGPNGAGKTTTINILTGLARPDSGQFRLGGLDCTGNPKAAQHLIGVVPDESNLYLCRYGRTHRG
jgi:ABC-2 type transport system ATP-binding protein